MSKAAAARAPIGWLHEAFILEGDVALDRAVGFSGQGKYDDARRFLTEASSKYLQAVRVAESDPVPYSRLCALGAIRMGLNLDAGGGVQADVIAAVDYCRNASEADPDLAQPYVDLARTYWNLATYQRRNGGSPLPTLARAVESANQAIALDPAHAKAYQHLGTALQQQGAHEYDTGADPRVALGSAVEAYDMALSLGLDDASLHNSLANTYAYLGDWERLRGMDPRVTIDLAIAEYRRLGEREPTNALPYGNMGITFKDLAMYEAANGRDPMPLLRESIAAYEEALRRNPNHAQTLNNAAQSWYRVGLTQFKRGGDPREALTQADASVDRAIEVNPTYATPYVNRTEVGLARAALLVSAGTDPTDELTRARASIRRALEINPGNQAKFYAHAARVELAEARWRLESGGYVTTLVADARGLAVRMQQVNKSDSDAWELLAQAAVIEARSHARQGRSPAAALESAQLAIELALKASPDAPWFVETSLDVALCRLEVGSDPAAVSATALKVAVERADKALARKSDSFRLQALAAVMLGAQADLTAALTSNPYLTREFAMYLTKK